MAEIKRLQPGAHLSKAVVHGNTAYLAGLVADDLDADAKGQTSQILTQIDKLLADCGTDKSKLLSAVIWVKEIRYREDVNTVWIPWVAKGQAPARACIEAKLANPKALVEIMVQAAI
jgi:enamine deaminase RidA (YjgF/YER057c/UK114 family)